MVDQGAEAIKVNLEPTELMVFQESLENPEQWEVVVPTATEAREALLDIRAKMDLRAHAESQARMANQELSENRVRQASQERSAVAAIEVFLGRGEILVVQAFRALADLWASRDVQVATEREEIAVLVENPAFLEYRAPTVHLVPQDPLDHLETWASLVNQVYEVLKVPTARKVAKENAVALECLALLETQAHTVPLALLDHRELLAMAAIMEVEITTRNQRTVKSQTSKLSPTEDTTPTTPTITTTRATMTTMTVIAMTTAITTTSVRLLVASTTSSCIAQHRG